MVKEYSKELMDYAVSLIVTDGQSVAYVAATVGIPLATLRTELRARRIVLRRDEQYKMAKITAMLYRMLETKQWDCAFGCTAQELELIEACEQYVWSVDDYEQQRQAGLNSNDLERKYALVVFYTDKTNLTALRAEWTRLTACIAKSLTYDQMMDLLTNAVMFYDQNDCELLSDEFFTYMSQKQKRWAKLSAAGILSARDRSILEKYDEIIKRSDGKLIHLWTQTEIADAVGLSQAQVNVIIKKWRPKCQEN